LEIFKKENPADPKNVWYERTVNKDEFSYIKADLYGRCKHDPKALVLGVPDVPTQAFTQPHKIPLVPDLLYLCPQWLEYLKAVGGYRQESWIFGAMHKQQLEQASSLFYMA
jgi:hypothetical protein